MRKRVGVNLRLIAASSVSLVVGLAIGSRFMRPPEPRSPVRQSEDAEEALDRAIPEIDLEGTPFDEALEVVRKLSPVPIVVLWEPLLAEGFNRRAPVTFRARNATLDRVLSELVRALRQLNGRSAAYEPRGDVILISTASDLRPDWVVRWYGLQGLVKLPANDPDIVTWSTAGPVFPGDELERLIVERTGGDYSWRNSGSIRIFAGGMIIVQTREKQRAIADLLAALREPAPPPAPPSPTPALSVWNNTLNKYISTDPSVGETAVHRRIPEVRIDGMPLDQAVTMLADQVNADLVANWPALEFAGVPRRTPVSLHLHDVTLAEALRSLLDANGAGKLSLRVDGGCIIFGEPSTNRINLTTRVYDVRDWLAGIVGSSTGSSPTSPANAKYDPSLHDACIGRMIKAIEGAIAPSSWKDADGDMGDIKELNGRLVITQTWENQERVADLLAALRADPSRLAPVAPVPP